MLLVTVDVTLTNLSDVRVELRKDGTVCHCWRLMFAPKESDTPAVTPVPTDRSTPDTRETAVQPAAPKRTDPAQPQLSARAVTAAIAVLALSAFVMILNETVLSVALPQLMHDFSVSATTVQWLTTGFLLTMAVVIPMTGFLLQRFTIRQLFLAALTMFLVGTIAAAVAPTFAIVLVARIVQAAGTAIVMPLLMTTTLTLVPPMHRGTVMGLNSIVISVGPAIGPTLSGIVTDALSWRWVFGGMIPIGAAALVIGAFLMPRHGGGGRASLDIPSVLLSLLGFGGIVTGVSTIADLSAGSPVPVVAGIVGVLGLVFFVLRQRALVAGGGGRALLDLSPFRERSFTLSVVLVMVAMGSMLGTVIVLPMFAQTAMGMSVLATGLMLLPGGVTQGLLSPVVGRLYDMVGPLPLVVPGTVLLAVAPWWMVTINADTTVPMLIAMHVVFSIGMALVLTPMLTHALSAVPVRLYGHGSAIVNALQQLAGAIGIAAMVGGLAWGAALSGLTGPAGEAAGVRIAFVVGGVIALVGVCAAPFIGKGARAAARGAR